jgi:hypothetical protein
MTAEREGNDSQDYKVGSTREVYVGLEDIWTGTFHIIRTSKFIEFHREGDGEEEELVPNSD